MKKSKFYQSRQPLCKYYFDILPTDVATEVGKAFWDYTSEKISKQEFAEICKQNEITVLGYHTTFRPKVLATAMRIANEGPLPKETTNVIFTSPYGKGEIKLNRDLFEALAKQGDEEAQEIVIRNTKTIPTTCPDMER